MSRSVSREKSKKVFLKYGNVCFYCKKSFSVSKLTIDHVIPKGAGGTNDINNLRVACYECNSKKSIEDQKLANKYKTFIQIVHPLIHPNRSHSHKMSYYKIQSAHINHDHIHQW